MTASAPVALEAHGVSKHFSGVNALVDVSLEVRAGETVGLVGENGAGKSTLLSVLSGALEPDRGQILIDGRPVTLTSYTHANREGIFRAQQDQGLVGNLSVAENLYLGHEAHFTTAGMLRVRRMRRAAEEQLRQDEILGGRIHAQDKIGGLPLDLRQLVEIARGFAVAELLNVASPVVLLDETTASLDHDEVQELYAHLRKRRGSASFLFVSHRLHEVMELCDRVYVLKDGHVVAERRVADTSEEELHHLMVGRQRTANQYLSDQRTAAFGSETLSVEGLTCEPHFRNVSLAVREGEIVGIAGIAGCGKSHVARAIVGDIPSKGTLTIDGKQMVKSGPSTRRGRVAYGPLDRHAEGVSLLQSLRWNLTWSSVGRYTTRGFLRPGREKKAVRQAIAQYEIATSSETTPVGKLSGGNQQKVMLARLVESGARVLVLDNPTRGVDVGARFQIYAQLRRMTATGLALLVVGDDLNELLGLADRLVVMRDGDLVQAWTQEETAQLDEPTVVARMV